jgi:hypothetical protein
VEATAQFNAAAISEFFSLRAFLNTKSLAIS